MTAPASAITSGFGRWLLPMLRRQWAPPPSGRAPTGHRRMRAFSGLAPAPRLSLTRLTFQVTHATADDTNAEREYIIAELSKHRVIEDVTSYEAGQHLPVGRVNHYIADGDVSVANLMVEAI